MKKISYWAKVHKTQARIIIIITFLILNGLAFFTGYLFRQIGISFLPGFLFASFLLYFMAFVAYPSKSKKGTRFSPSSFYMMQKSCDFVLVASTFCMYMYVSNSPASLNKLYPQAKAFVITHPKDSVAKNYKNLNDFTLSLKDKAGNWLKWKERKKLLKEQVREIKKDNNLSRAQKTLLIILSVIAALGLFILVLGLSCSLSCSGSDAAAAIVGIGGTALIIFLLIIVLKSINGKHRKRTPVGEGASQSAMGRVPPSSQKWLMM